MPKLADFLELDSQQPNCTSPIGRELRYNVNSAVK
jgi:hypothetical protein